MNRGILRVLAILWFILMAGCGNNPTHNEDYGEFYVQQTEISKNDLINAFDRFDRSLNNGAGYSYNDNLNGALAWNESYIMSAYLNMYRGTGDAEYLRKFIRHAENVLARRDDKLGYYNYRGISGPTWLSTVFTNGHRYAFLVHSGMITYPMVDFAQMVKWDASLWHYKSYNNKDFIEMADEFIARVSETIEAHHSEWDNNLGAYRFNKDAWFDEYRGKILPFNHQNSMGRTLLAMYRATGNDFYLDKSIKLARYFSYNLILQRENNAYVWTYWVIYPNIEDISHGAIDFDFAHLCYQNGIMFNGDDMRHFTNTFRKNIYKAPMALSERVDGTGEINKHLYQGGRWLALSEIDRNIYRIISDIFTNKVLYQDMEYDGSIFLSVANLVRYY